LSLSAFSTANAVSSIFSFFARALRVTDRGFGLELLPLRAGASAECFFFFLPMSEETFYRMRIVDTQPGFQHKTAAQICFH
jgi:hypothetical protein